MFLELQQINYIDGTPSHDERAGYIGMDPGYGLLQRFVDRRDVIVVSAANSFGGVASLAEAIDALRFHEMSFAGGDPLGRPYPFATRISGRTWDDEPASWHERVMYLHDFTPDDIEEIHRVVG